jgi:hypothetical protein
MACESEWAAYQQAIADRIASEIVEAAAIAARQEAQYAEWTACMAWWYCGEQGMQSSGEIVDPRVPTRIEAFHAKEAADFACQAARSRVEHLKAEYLRVTGKAYEGGK